MKKLTRVLLTAFLACAAQFAGAVTYSSADLLLVFHEAGYNDVEFDVGSVSNLLNLAAATQVPISYDMNLVSNNFNNTFSNVIVSLVATPSLGDSLSRVWLSDADLVDTPSELTPNSYATLASIVNTVGLRMGTNNPYVVSPASENSYSYIVSGGTQTGIGNLGGDAPFIVDVTCDSINTQTNAFYEMAPTEASPVPSAIQVGTFTISPIGVITFTASAVTPVITASPVPITVRAGAAPTFSVSADEGSVQWYSNGVAIANATNSSYTVANAQPGNVGPYSVTVSNSTYGTSATSSGAMLTVIPSYVGGDLQLAFHESGYNDVEYDIGSVSNLIGLASGTVVQIPYSVPLVTGNFNSTLSNVNFAVVGTPSLGDGDSRVWLSDADLVDAPVDVTPGTYAALASTVDSVGNRRADVTHSFSAPLVISPNSEDAYSYIVSGGTEAGINTLGGAAPFTVDATMNTVSSKMLALYELVPTLTSPTPVAVQLGTFTMTVAGALSFTASPVTPVITASPVAATIRGGGSTTFSVTAEAGSSYQWYSNGVAIAGATGASYTVSNAQPGNKGPYSVTVSNSTYGTSATSSGAMLTVIPSYVGGDLQLAFHESGYNDVEYDIGSVSNLIGLASGTVVQIPYSVPLVTGNFNSTLSNVNFAVVGTPSLGDGDSRVWLSDADLVDAPVDVTPGTYAALASTVDSVGNRRADVTHSFSAPLVISPNSEDAYSYIVSGGTEAGINTLGGAAPFTVDATMNTVSSKMLALYELVPTLTSPTPVAVQLGTFTMTVAGALSFTASPVTPVITASPVAATIRGGGSTTFSVTAEAGSSYQWYSNGVAIAGATGASYTVSNAQPGNKGPYSVTVSNSTYGTSATSSGAMLTVIPSYVGGDLQLAFHESGYNDVEYDIGSVSNLIGLASGTVVQIPYSVPLVTGNFNSTLSNVNFAVVGTPSLGDGDSRVWLSDADLVDAPVDVTPGTYAALASTVDSVGNRRADVTHSFSAPLVISPNSEDAYSYIVSGGTEAGINTLGGAAPFTVDATMNTVSSKMLALYELVPTLTSPTPVAVQLGTFTMTAAGALSFTASAVTPVITTPNLANQTVGVGGTTTFSVSAEGATGYQWLKNGTNLNGQTSSSLTIANAQLSDAASYSVQALNGTYGTSVTSSSAQLTVVAQPYITSPPVSLTVFAGATATFSVSATNAYAGGANPAYAYQWYFNSAPLSDGGIVSGSATAFLNLDGVQSSNAGNYTVSVSNVGGAATNSPAAVLAVVAPPQVNLVTTNGNVILSGANGIPGDTYVVLGSTNVALPLAQWTPISTNQFDGGGNFSATNAVNPGLRYEFFTLQLH